MNMDQKIIKELQDIKKALVNVVTKDDLRQELLKYPSKDDLNIALEKLREDIAEDTSDVIRGFIESTDERKAERSDVKSLDKRVTKIERKLSL